MIPRNKWGDKKANLKIGDVGFLLYTSKFSRPTWRACRVLALHPDRTGTVRTVTVGLWRHAAGKGTATSRRGH